LLLFSKRRAFFLSMRQPQGNRVLATAKAGVGDLVLASVNFG
jgi:hypothetical protein